MFRRKPSTAKTPISSHIPISASTATAPIPEDESVPLTPAIPFMQNTVSWDDTPASWTSSNAAYDVNSRYTTANNSYTHRRKSSLIAGLIVNQNDPYQPRYQDWRNRTRDSPQNSLSLIPSVSKEYNGDVPSWKKYKMFAAFLIILVLALFGGWIFEGPLPLANLNGLKNPFRGTFAGDIWPTRMGKPNINWKKYKHTVSIDWDIQRFIPEKLRQDIRSEGSAEPHSFTGTEDTQQKSVIPPATRPIHTGEDGVTAVGPPVQARSETTNEDSAKESTNEFGTGNLVHV